MIKISRRLLLAALSFCQGALEKKSTIPILASLRVIAEDDTMRLAATDLDIAKTITVDADVTESSSFCVPGKRFLEVITALDDGEVEIIPGDIAVTVKQGKSRFKINTQPAANFAEVPTMPKSQGRFPVKQFAAMLAACEMAATTEESRYALCGVKMELTATGMRLIATDGHRLSYTEMAGSFFANELLIPKKTVIELVKWLQKEEGEVEVAVDDNHIYFSLRGRTIISRTLTGQFPNWEMVLPKAHTYSLGVTNEGLSAAIRRVQLMADERSHSIRLTANDILTLEAQASDAGDASETLDLTQAVPNVVIGLNASYALEYFNYVPKVGGMEIRYTDGSRQIEFRQPESVEEVQGFEFRYVIMPLRI